MTKNNTELEQIFSDDPSFLVDHPFYRDALEDWRDAAVRAAREAGRKEALELIAKQSAWEDSYDHFARQLGLPAKYGHSCDKCVTKDSKKQEEA
jgi:hypothetical protein